MGNLLKVLSEQTEGTKETCQTHQRDCSMSDLPAVRGPAGYGGNVAFITLGCAKNTVDSEVMMGVLQQKGFRPVAELENADLIVVNTCSFLQSAVEEGIDRILEAASFKQTGRCRRLIVAGCMVERYRADLRKNFPEVDGFISTDELLKIGDTEDTSTDCFDQARRPYFIYDESMPRTLSTGGASAYIKISEGCNRPCSFCIIPRLRGPFRSRPIPGIINEARSMLDAGIKEINLVGQDLTAYGSDFPGVRPSESRLVDLLKQLDSLPGDYWVRLLYAYPLGVNEELIELLLGSSHLAKYLDLPLQHISNRILKSMNRPLGERGTRRLIENIRLHAPQVALRTTFITGFPGETAEDVSQLCDFVAEGHFTHVGVFTYSQEEEAASFSLPNQVDEETKKDRYAQIMEVQKRVSSKRLKELVGKDLKVLLEGSHPETDLLYTGRTDWQAPDTDGQVIINDLDIELAPLNGEDQEASIRDFLTKNLGNFLKVRITDISEYDLIGSVIGKD